jgi:hypothetical protein
MDYLLLQNRHRQSCIQTTPKIVYVDDDILSLRTDDSNLSTEDARDRIEKGCVGIWSKRTILLLQKL